VPANRNALESAQQHRAARQRASLSRMRWLATALFCAMLLLFILSLKFEKSMPSLRWVRAFAEAAVVGAAADWYAVVALFRRPFGLPLPHTAILPGRKDAIAEGMAELVGQNFLTSENIGRQLGQQNSAAALGRWLAENRNHAALAQAFCELLPGMLAAVEDEQVHRLLERILMSQLARFDPLAVVTRFFEHLIDHDREQLLLENALAAIRSGIFADRGLIRENFAQSARFIPALVD